MSKIKICGLICLEDIEAVNSAMPDYVGFVFAPSRRRVNLQTAAKLKERLDSKIESVGVFVNEDIETIKKILDAEIINLAQLHGDEDDIYIEQLKAKCGCRVIKSVGIGDSLPQLPTNPDYLLFDTLSKNRGGTGESFNWNILKNYIGIPYFLAGGLSSDNIKDAINLLAPFCVDISSGAESGGSKDADKIQRLVRLVTEG